MNIYIHTYIHGEGEEGGGRGGEGGGWGRGREGDHHRHHLFRRYIIMYYHEFVLSLNTHHRLRARWCHMGIIPPPPPLTPPPQEMIPYGKRPPEGIPYGKPSPGRNPIAGFPQGYNTIWQAFPPEEIPWQNFPLYGKSPPTQIPYVILGQHVRFVLGGGGTKSHRWGTFTMWYFIRGKEIHGGGGDPM